MYPNFNRIVFDTILPTKTFSLSYTVKYIFRFNNTFTYEIIVWVIVQKMFYTLLIRPKIV